MSAQGIIDRNNRDVLAEMPVSDWMPNLKGKGVPEPIVDSFRRVTLELQAVQRKLADHAQTLTTLDETVNKPADKTVLTAFTELTVGSPATPEGAVRIRSGKGTPEAVVIGTAQRDIWFQTDGGAGTFCYAKETGTDTKTGWTAKF